MKQPSASSIERVGKMTFASVYPMYVSKVEKKGRTKAELHQVITWLTGYDDAQLRSLMDEQATFRQFFDDCRLNPNAHLITGVICGYWVGNSKTRSCSKCATWTSWSMNWRAARRCRAFSALSSCAGIELNDSESANESKPMVL